MFIEYSHLALNTSIRYPSSAHSVLKLSALWVGGTQFWCPASQSAYLFKLSSLWVCGTQFWHHPETLLNLNTLWLLDEYLTPELSTLGAPFKNPMNTSYKLSTLWAPHTQKLSTLRALHEHSMSIWWVPYLLCVFSGALLTLNQWWITGPYSMVYYWLLFSGVLLTLIHRCTTELNSVVCYWPLFSAVLLILI